MKINKYEFGHMTNLAAMPVHLYMVKSFKKRFFSGTNGLIALKLGL